MFTVALIGADGAGKSTVTGRLPDTLSLPMKSIYMGINLDSSTLMLPTTRLLLFLRRIHGNHTNTHAATLPAETTAASASSRLGQGARAGARLAIWMSEEIFRQSVAWYYSRVRRKVVVFDRHFFADYYADDVADATERRPLSRRIHGFMLLRAYAKPDLVVFLDAPPELLYARKPETPVAWLRNRREEYARLRNVVPHFVRVDASRPLDEVTREVASVIERFDAARRADGAARPGRAS
jgi:thymidylate kinase